MPFFVTLLLYAAFFVLGELLRPKPSIENAKPAGLGDFSFPTATEGRSVPLLWGTCKISGPNVVWYGALRQVPITEKIKTGMFSSTRVIRGYRYYLGVQFALCRGTVGSFLRLWIGDKEVYSGTTTDGNAVSLDLPDFFGGDDLGNGGIVGDVRFFAGSSTQAVSGYLAGNSVSGGTVSAAGAGYLANEILTVSGGTFTRAARFQVLSVSGGAVATLQLIDAGAYTVVPSNPAATTASGAGAGATITLLYSGALQSQGGDTPAYRGTSYVLFEGGYLGNSTSIKPWAFEVRRIPTGPATGANESVNGGQDANLVNVAYEIFTDTNWGLGFATSTIDTVSWAAAGAILKSEGNGFSMLLDNPMEATELLKEIERQMDGVILFNQLTSKWEISLARGGYDINTKREITVSNRISLESYTRGSWEDTTNHLRVQFNDRSDSYKQTFALAQDMANVRLQNGVNVSGTNNYPGVKDKTLANQLSWRDLRTVSYPLAKASVIVDRTFYDTQIGEVVAFTDADLELSKLPMRVIRVNLGEIDNGQITLDLVQDVFIFTSGVFADPPPSGWVAPSDTLLPFDTDKQKAFEAPRGFVTRDPSGDGLSDKIWCGARRKGPEVSFRIVERHALGTPAGAYATAGEAFGLLLIGSLSSTLATGTAVPTASVTLFPYLETQSEVLAAFLSATPTDLGTNLVQLMLVGDEFMLGSSAQASGGNVQVNNVYRGVLDSVQATHAAGTPVWLVFVGGALTDTLFTPGHTVDVKLLPHSSSDIVDATSATAIQLLMANRIRKPYPPCKVNLAGTPWATTGSLESTGAAGESYGIIATLQRRDYRTMDEVASLGADAAALVADFPTANTTTHEIDVRNDPSGANTLLFTASGGGTDITLLRNHILRYTNGVLPTTLRLVMRALHTDNGTSYSSLQTLVWDFTPTTVLTGQFNFGAKAANVTSNLYTATVNGTYSFTLSSAFTVGTVQYRLNGGAFTSLITAGNTTGNIAGVVATDTIEVRHTSSDVGAEKFLVMDAPGIGQDGYAVLYV